VVGGQDETAVVREILLTLRTESIKPPEHRPGNPGHD
jgi:hypothetical protein